MNFAFLFIFIIQDIAGDRPSSTANYFSKALQSYKSMSMGLKSQKLFTSTIQKRLYSGLLADRFQVALSGTYFLKMECLSAWLNIELSKKCAYLSSVTQFCPSEILEGIVFVNFDEKKLYLAKGQHVYRLKCKDDDELPFEKSSSPLRIIIANLKLSYVQVQKIQFIPRALTMNDFFKNLPCSKDKDFVMVPMCSTANRRVKRKVSKGLIIVELAILCLFLGLAAAAAAALARYLKHRKRRKKEVRIEKRLRTQDVEKEEILRRDMFANTTNGENQERSSHQTRQQDRSTKSYTIGTNSSRSEDVSVFSVNSSYDGQETNTIDDKNVPSEPAKWQQSSTDKDCSKKDVVLKTETHDNETVYDDKIVQKTEMISRVTKDIFGQREEDTKKVEQRTVAETTESEKSDKEKTAAREIENQITDKTDEMNKDGDEKDKLSEQQTIGTTTVIKTSNASLVSILLAASEKSTDNKSEELKTESKAKRKISTSSPKQKTDEKDDSKNKSSQIESPPKAKEDDILKTDILKSDVKMNQPTKPGKSGEESSSLRKKAFDKPEKGPKLRRTSAEEQAAQKEIVAKVLRKTESPSSSSLHENTSITLPNIHID